MFLPEDKGKTAKAKTDADKKDKEAAKDTPEDEAEKLEAEAARKLKFTKELYEMGKKERAKERLAEIIEKYPKSKAADEARELQKKWMDDAV